MRAISRRTIALAIAAVIVVIGAAGSYAYWTSGGAGSGTAATGTSADLVVQQTSVVTAMAPGVDAQPLSGNFDNANAASIHVDRVSVVVAGTDHAGCTAADYTITGSPMVVDAQVSTGLGQGAWTGAAIAFNNTDVNQDTCQGAIVTLTYTILPTLPLTGSAQDGVIMVEIEVQPRHRNRRPVLVGVALLALLLTWLFSCDPGSRVGLGGDGAAGLGDTSFTIGGNATEAMSPGLMVGIDMQLTNPHDKPMLVSEVAVTAASVSAPLADVLHPCSLLDFTVVQPADDLLATVPAHTTRSLSSLGLTADSWPHVGMIDRSVNQDGCQGAVVTLAYSGSGRLPD